MPSIYINAQKFYNLHSTAYSTLLSVTNINPAISDERHFFLPNLSTLSAKFLFGDFGISFFCLSNVSFELFFAVCHVF
jgi:hypothetical protein